MHRITRKDRYKLKTKTAKKYPIHVASVCFMHDGNIAYLIRAAACFGAKSMFVIGRLPPRKVLNPLSGSTYDYVDIIQFANPNKFLKHMRNLSIKLVCAEITEDAVPLANYKFDFSTPICIVTGHEECGVPTDLLINSDVVKIDTSGIGYCLNTAQTANIMLYEAIKQFKQQQI
ncbi:hypothetical protein CMI47_13160 [Candidatus Pacearchaeota archaeon]|nr:hypothetical protein [Candidatus Pacearchaeota archaeon]|tara:strand:+ start:15792 stop:16313 length:522 start_codon:yes stop_codon:yes gene_type:complete